MYWDKLLNPIRNRIAPTVEKSENDLRSEFKKDFDAVCNSTMLRRLQDKAQVSFGRWRLCSNQANTFY